MLDRRFEILLDLVGCVHKLASDCSRLEPEFGVMFRFVFVEFGFVAEGEADVVEAVQQAVFAERVDVEVCIEAFIVRDGLGFKVDCDFVCWISFGALHQRLHIGFGEADEDHAVFAGVREENVGEAGGDDGEEAEVGECPGCVFARAAAAEVFSGDEDLCTLVMVLVEDEGFVGLAIVGAVLDAAPIVEEEVAVASALNAFEELFGDDLVGVDVGAVERDSVAGENVDGMHIYEPRVQKQQRIQV